MSKKQICIIISFILVVSVGIVIFGNSYFKKESKNNSNLVTVIENNSNNKFLSAHDVAVADAETRMTIVYDGMTLEELAAKLDRFLSSDLAGKGYLYASHSLEIGIDPYLAVAISMHETGCAWGCSRLVKECNNVGGQKGSPSCNGGSYKAYATLDEGIIGFLDNIYYNYYRFGLTTAEAMNPKYAADTNWSKNVNKTIEKIRNI